LSLEALVLGAIKLREAEEETAIQHSEVASTPPELPDKT
jgi:hypothetical protein